MTKNIRVKNTDDIQKINAIVSRYGYDIWIHGKSGMVDAVDAHHSEGVVEDDIDAAPLFRDLADFLEIED